MRTWIELDRKALKHNYRVFRKLIGRQTGLWAVVKSNAYGHGLFDFARSADELGVDGLCVDSITEGMALRREGMGRPILVLGPTLPGMLGTAAGLELAVTVPNFENLRGLMKLRKPPAFHLKIDTGMHRQGFYPEDIPGILRLLGRSKARADLAGVYTHFAAATKKGSVPTERQFQKFLKVKEMFLEAGYGGIKFHCSATGGTVVDKRYHLDMVRVGKGLYGFLPSPELESSAGLKLKPVLAWRTIITEIKNLKAGDRVGYDLTEAVRRPSRIAILPVGYWHGFPRSLSSKGQVLIRGRKAKVLGRVSMDLLTVDVTGIPCRTGDTATLIGRDGGSELRAPEVAGTAGTIAYEFLTRLNPLIQKIWIGARA